MISGAIQPESGEQRPEWFNHSLNQADKLSARWDPRLTLNNLALAKRYFEGEIRILVTVRSASRSQNPIDFIAVLEGKLAIGGLQGQRGKRIVTKAHVGECIPDDLRSLLHRTFHAAGTSGRGHRPSQFRLGHATSPQLGDGGSLGEDPVPDP